MKQSNTNPSLNYRILIGIAVIIEAYLLYFNSSQRQSFHSQISSMGLSFDIQSSYQAIQSVRYIFIAVTYSFGLAIVLGVGREYFARYFGIKIGYQVLFMVFGKDPLKCLLLICVNTGFIVIFTSRLTNQSNKPNQNDRKQEKGINVSVSQSKQEIIQKDEGLLIQKQQN